MLASADGFHYVQEPFNIVARQRWLTPRPSRQFLYLTDANGGPYEPGMQRVVDLRYPLLDHLRTRPSPQLAKRVARITLDATQARRQGAKPVMKDPIALFSAEWLQDRFKLQPVIVAREPVAFVGSLKDRDWTFDFAHWADQPLLLSEVAGAWRDRINAAVSAPLDIVDQGILQWNVFYDFVADLRDRRPDTVVVSYERLAGDAATEVPALFERLGLAFGPSQQAAVAELTTAGDSQGASAIDVHRQSDEVLDTWRARLDEDEIARVRAGTAGVADRLADL
jgi:hypothetical protein